MKLLENFKIIAEFPRYVIGDKGTVKNVKTGNVINPRKASNGYLRVGLRLGNVKYEKPKTRSVHRLVAEAFLPKIIGKDYVNHKNLDKIDNNVANLEWCTAKENSQHVFKNNLSYAKKCHKNLAISHEKAKQKIVVYQNNKILGIFKGKKSVASFLGVSEKTVYNCLHGIHNRQGYKMCVLGGDGTS